MSRTSPGRAAVSNWTSIASRRAGGRIHLLAFRRRGPPFLEGVHSGQGLVDGRTDQLFLDGPAERLDDELDPLVDHLPLPPLAHHHLAPGLECARRELAGRG